MNEPLHLIAETPTVDPLDESRTFEAFYNAEGQTLFRRLWIMTGSRSEAEELMQDAFLKVWERWERVYAMDDPVGYLYRTAMNLFRKRYRRAAMVIRRSIGLAPSRDDFADADDRETVRRVLSVLPPRQRAALVLTELLGFSPTEAGAGSPSLETWDRICKLSAGRRPSWIPLSRLGSCSPQGFPRCA